MKHSYIKGIIHSNIQISTNIYELKIKSEDIDGRPGQFYMIRGWELDPFLSRPISICDISNGMMTFLYEVMGKGTHIISNLKKGDTLELLGPLGNGFDFDLKGNIAIISGGIGIAPMIYLIKELQANIDFYCGFRNEVYYIDKLKKYVSNVYISTENGSVGHKGFVTELFIPEKYDAVLTCGPIPMMKAVAEICEDKVPVYISMENRMACGVGACLGCTIETTSGMKRVCKDGPVFTGEEVFFND